VDHGPGNVDTLLVVAHEAAPARRWDSGIPHNLFVLQEFMALTLFQAPNRQGGHAGAIAIHMSYDLQQLVDVDGRINDAIRQLREQRRVITEATWKQANFDALLSLLSGALRQYYWLEKQRRMLIRNLGAKFLLGSEIGAPTRATPNLGDERGQATGFS
jgi:hypothetical protein